MLHQTHYLLVGHAVAECFVDMLCRAFVAKLVANVSVTEILFPKMLMTEKKKILHVV